MPKVNLSESLFRDVQSRVPKTEFETVDEYVEFVLQEVLHNVRQRESEADFDVDEDEVKDRLRSLGYID